MNPQERQAFFRNLAREGVALYEIVDGRHREIPADRIRLYEDHLSWPEQRRGSGYLYRAGMPAVQPLPTDAPRVWAAMTGYLFVDWRPAADGAPTAGDGTGAAIVQGLCRQYRVTALGQGTAEERRAYEAVLRRVGVACGVEWVTTDAEGRLHRRPAE